MNLIKLTIPTVFLASCAHIQPIKEPVPVAKKAPTQIINEFGKETESLVLEKAIENDTFIKRDQTFLRPSSDKKVQFWIDYYGRKKPDMFLRFSKNGERYRELIEGIFEKYGLPKELYYVGIVESGYQYRARSHAGAVGPWQFVKGTATRYGLRVNRSIDERQNIYKATEAAALYFQDLYNIFGTWELALAAYNAGEYGVIRRIRGANTRKYYELSKLKKLPKETRHYVPKVLAVMYIDQHRNKFNLPQKSNSKDFYIKTKSIKVHKRVSLNRLAKSLNLPKRVLVSLNRDIKTGIVPGRYSKPIEVFIPSTTTKIPKEITQRPKRRIASKSYKKNDSQIHRVRKNESLYAIAKRYNTTISVIKKLNKIRGSKIFPGQKIILPFEKYGHIQNIHRVRSGDNLSSIARIYNTSIKELKKLNNLKSSRILVGQTIKVPPYKVKYYIVKRGDHLTRIAKSKGIHLTELRELNNVNQTIFPGQKIILSIKSI